MAKSFKATIKTIESIMQYYKDLQDEVSNTSIYFKASCKDFTVLIYSNFTVLFQGKNAEKEASKWVEIKSEQQSLDLFEKPEVINDEVDHIGSDEVGCGDYFGPVVVAATLVRKKDYQYLLDIGVKDSKQLNDEKIRKLAPLVKEKVISVTFTLNNEKYNNLIKQGSYNLNKLKAYLHNFVLYNLSQKTNFNDLIVVDQFCSESLFYKYLQDYKSDNIQKNITFTTKAENKYIAVACASIIARDTFLNEIEKLNETLNKTIILGASDKVDKLAKEILDEKGIDYLSKFVKLHFKNTKKIQEM